MIIMEPYCSKQVPWPELPEQRRRAEQTRGQIVEGQRESGQETSKQGSWPLREEGRTEVRRKWHEIE